MSFYSKQNNLIIFFCQIVKTRGALDAFYLQTTYRNAAFLIQT